MLKAHLPLYHMSLLFLLSMKDFQSLPLAGPVDIQIVAFSVQSLSSRHMGRCIAECSGTVRDNINNDNKTSIIIINAYGTILTPCYYLMMD